MSENEKMNGAPETNDAETPELVEEIEEVEELVQASPLEAALAQVEEYKDLALRSRAELENFRRRTNKEREELFQYGSQKVLADLLSVLDDMERAQQHADDGSPLAEGFHMMHAALLNIMKKHGVSEVPGVGAPFDPNFHEAIQQVQSDVVEKGQVAEVYQKGYMLHDRLLRAAMVSVAN